MLNLNFRKYCFLLILLGTSWSQTAEVLQQEKAFSLLENIGQRSFQVTFRYTIQSPQGELEETFEKGQITIQNKNSKYRLTLPEQEVISDGQTVWTYLKEANEVQIADHAPEQGATTPWTILTNYQQDYVVSGLRTQQMDDQICDVIDLMAKNEENFLQKITLTIEQTTKHIKRLETLDDNQTLHIFSIIDFAYNPKLDKAFFKFNATEHSGVEIIDMR